MLHLPRPNRLINKFRAGVQGERIDPDTVRLILDQYGLTAVHDPHPPGNRGRRSTLIVETGEGKRLLKRYGSTSTAAMIVHEHSILQHLARVNFPAPRLVITGSGATQVASCDDHFALFEYIEGGWHYHDYLWTAKQTQHFISLAGELLAKLHAQLVNFSAEGENPNGFISPTEGRWRHVDWYLSKLSACVQGESRPGRASAAQLGYLMHHEDRLRNTLLKLDHELETANLPRVIIHGDYGPYNLLFTDTSQITVLDFEIARLDWRLSEFVYALPRFASHPWKDLSFTNGICFIEAYRKVLELNSDELHLLPSVWQYLKIRQAIASWNKYCESGSSSHLTDAISHLKWESWAEMHCQKLVDELLKT